MRRRPLSEWVPPWANAKAHLGAFLALLILPVLYSLASYLPMLSLALSQVHVYGQPDVVDPGSRMTDFADLVGIQGAVSNFFSRPVFFPFLLMLGGAGVLAVVYRLSFRWGSRSDYLMGRLPHRWELARRSFCLPLVLALVTLGGDGPAAGPLLRPLSGPHPGGVPPAGPAGQAVGQLWLPLHPLL